MNTTDQKKCLFANATFDMIAIRNLARDDD